MVSGSATHKHNLASSLEVRRIPDAYATKGVFIGISYMHGCCISPSGRSRPSLLVMVAILALTQKAYPRATRPLSLVRCFLPQRLRKPLPSLLCNDTIRR